MSQPIGDRPKGATPAPPKHGDPLIAVRPDREGETDERVYYDSRGYPVGFLYPSTVIGWGAELSNESLPTGLDGLLFGLGIPSLPLTVGNPDPPYTFEMIQAEFEARLKSSGWTIVTPSKVTP